MAEDQTAIEADDGAHVEDEAALEQNDQPDPYAELATEMGWKPKDQFTGPEDSWKPAKDFILAGRDIQQSTSRELRSLREQMERIGGVTEHIVQTSVAKARAEWEAEFDRAVEEGDTARARELRKQEPAAEPQKRGPDPTVEAWVAKNPWFNTDPVAGAVAREVSARNANLPVADQLAAAEKEVKRRFPEYFAPATKAPPATQTGQNRNANPSNRAKGFADMPDAARTMALDYEERLGVKKEDFAKSYWKNNEGVKR